MLKSMRNYILLFLSVLCIGCHKHSEHWETLLDVESYIESRPDIALSVLKGINADCLSCASEKAKHSLLTAMALDKNYVDTTDFSVLQPALDWYEHHGSPTDRLRTFFYQGRIYENKNDDESAMECFVKALDFVQKSDDILTKARLLFQESRIYCDLYYWDRMIETRLAAAEYFEEAGRLNSYINCILGVANCYYLQNDKEQAELYVDICKDKMAEANIRNKINYCIMRLENLSDDVSKEEVGKIIDEYFDLVDDDKVNWIVIAKAYLHMGDISEAVVAIQKKDASAYSNYRLQYYATKSLIYRDTDMYKEALDAYMNYVSLSDSLDMAIFKQDTKFVEDRYKLELAAVNERAKRNFSTVVVISVVLLSGCLILWNRSRLRILNLAKQISDSEAERYRLLYCQIEGERDNLASLLEEKNNGNSAALKVVASRLEILNKFLHAHITKNCEVDRKAAGELDTLVSNREDFMDSNRLAFSGSHPEFIAYLKDCNLSEYEINYCCLYAIGLRGKDVGAYMNMRSHYNVSSAIREKLGIGEHDTNLGIYLRKLLVNLPS